MLPLHFALVSGIIRGRSPPPPPEPSTDPVESVRTDPAVGSVLAQLRSGLTQQVQEQLEESGSSITIMVVGETGCGKTSLLCDLFHADLDWPVGTRTPKVQEQTVTFQLDGATEQKGVPFVAHLIDSPGWGDLMSLPRSFGLVTRHIEKRYGRELAAESRLHRKVHPPTPGYAATQRCDVVLYTFSPHRCKGIDMAFLKRLAKQVSIVPVLTKADTMTPEELKAFRGEVSEALPWQRVFALACDKIFHVVRPLWCLLLLCVSVGRLALGDRAGSAEWVVTRRRERPGQPR